MKKINTAGFTLIELLAVITIMGILMMVAIPSVSRTIENSRRDTFADNALTYISTVRNSVLADEVKCQITAGNDTTAVTASGTPNGTYYFAIDTEAQQTKDIMERVATSSWGGAKLTGYIKIAKIASGQRTITTYSVCLRDTGNHGFGAETEEKDVSRSKIVTTDAAACSLPSGAKLCKLK